MATFGPCLKVGEFLFPSGLMAVGHDGDIVGSAVSPDFPGLAHAGCSQAEAVFGYAEALCGAAGTTMDRLLRAQYFVADITAFAGIAMAWSARYRGRPHPFVCVQTSQQMPAPGAALIADFWISTAP
jgi:enamine deaminase RidA (YjgF/YER057c/UK114 family)